MTATDAATADRVTELLRRAGELEEQGVPFPTESIRTAIEKAVATNDTVKTGYVLDRAERLLVGTLKEWEPVERAISKAEVLRTTAEELGIGVAHLDANVGNPRAFVQAGPISAELFRNAERMATTSIELLRRAIPERAVAEARKLGVSIQAAQRRGEDVQEATTAFRALLAAVRGEPSPVLVQRLSAVRRAVQRIPSPPAIAFPEIDDADEILLEARILARRINRIKRNARDAQSAARLMAHVRAALAEDRRGGSPQEEIEELWGEVTRLTNQSGSHPTTPAVPRPARQDPGPIRSRDPRAPARLPSRVPSEDVELADARARRAAARRNP